MVTTSKNGIWILRMASWDILRFQEGFICSYDGHFEAPRRASKVWKWVSYAYPVNMGQVDHHVVNGTKSGAIQDFQRGKKHPVGVKQTPLNPFIDPPQNQLNPSSHLKAQKHPRNPPNPN